jgi:hypothetical protein
VLSISLSDIPGLWRQFLIDLTFAKDYPIGYIDLPGPAPRNPVLEQLLPSLLHIKAVAILDHALRTWIDAKGMTVPKKPYGTDLKGRIDFLADNNILSNRVILHTLRGLRNDLAHEPQEAINWSDLDRDVATINEALKDLQLVGDMPHYEIFSERSGAQESPDPKVNWVFHYRIAVREAGKIVAEIKWSESLLNDDA